MGEIVYSEEQLQVINTAGKNILVSAAAGSGKTTVLVKRIIRKITDKEAPVDIDKILVLTYTDAAAGEMRSRIEDAIEQAISANPDDKQLTRQAVLIHNAQISTIHGFCLSLIRNNFTDIGIDPSFRVAETGEIKLIEGRVADELIESLFESENDDIELLADRFFARNSLKRLKEIIIDTYAICRNNPFVREYIEERRNDYRVDDQDGIFEAAWGRELKEYAKKTVEEAIELTNINIELTQSPGGPFMYLDALEADRNMLEGLTGLKTYDDYYLALRSVDYARLSSKKSAEVSDESKALSKGLRDDVKHMITELKDRFFCLNSEAVLKGMHENQRILEALANVLLLYDENLEDEKSRRKVIDFSDMEHYAIRILLKKQDGEYVPTKTALDYRAAYDEIMVDEYQDSNTVQEKMLEAIAADSIGHHNRFMVGDVKQSIYSFRRACPELFMEKYEIYGQDGDTSVRIDLSANYRSRKEVVNCVNHVFERLMDKDLGNIAYDNAARLYAGAEYKETGEDHASELLIAEYDNDSDSGKKEQEARLVATKIKELVGKYKICDKDVIRPCKYKDIVILLRTNKGWDDAFKRVLESYGIPTFVSSKTGYFSATEIKSLLNLLKILDNPRNEIELYGILTSVFGGFTDDEIALIRTISKGELIDSITDIAENACDTDDPAVDEIRDKCVRFMDFFKKYRKKVVYTPINELLEEIIRETGYMLYVSSLPYGEQRRNNVYMLIEKAKKYESASFKGLYHFIRYINEIQSYEIDYGEASTVDEQADVVRIMSIHKSKGLEFPICFVCGMAKEINFRDTYETMLFEKKLGIGLQYVDIEKNVKHTDIRHRILARRMKLEDVAEEMRILYVAMTRAKEKLFMTACVSDAETVLEKYRGKTAFMSGSDSRALPYYIRCGIKSFLEAILYTYNGSDALKVSICTSDQLVDAQTLDGVSKERRRTEISNAVYAYTTGVQAESDIIREAKNKIMFKYPYQNLEDLYTKTSVSELKIAAIRDKLISHELEELPDQFFTEHDSERYIPNFVSASEKVSGTARGSAYHRVMELYDFAGSEGFEKLDCESQFQKVKAVMDSMVQAGRIDRQQAELVDIKKLVLFMESGLGQRMCRAAGLGKLKIEQPFVLGISAGRLNKEFPDDEQVLIQGIIDVFFEEDGELVLMDYKTDAVKEASTLIERYELQLDYYKEALEKILGKRVKQKLIYSFALNRTIELA